MGGLIPFGQGPLLRGYRGCPIAPHPQQLGAVKQNASVLFLVPKLMGLLMDLNVPRGGLRHMSEFMSRRGVAYTAARGLPFLQQLPSRDLSRTSGSNKPGHLS